MAWHVFAAAAIGKSHIDAGIPCQDAFAHERVGDTLIAVVCDGAGSQPRSDLGATLMTAAIARGLAGHARRGAAPERLDADAFKALAQDVVAAARDALEALANAEGVPLCHYAATLVGVVAGADGGHFFHVGDGIGAAQPREASLACVVSPPENGEYANETFFVTGEGWQEHLRITPIPSSLRSVALMSDGAMPFAMAKDLSAPFRPFIDPVERYLAGVAEPEGSQALAGTLEDPRTHQITADDKTLLIALWQ